VLVGYFGRSLGLRGGIGRYARELLAGMERAAPANQYLLYTNRQPDTELGANTILRAGPRRLGRVGYEQFWLPAQLMRDMPDVYHSPDYTLPLAARGSFVITVHDLIYLRHPEGTSLRARVLYRVLTRASIARARKVITVSDYTAREIAEYFRVPREKLRVIPHGVNPHLQRLAESADSPAALARLGVRKPFVLFVGLLTPRKGVLELIEAFERIQPQTRLECLVLAGSPGAGYERITERISASPVRERILLAGPADDVTLASLYSEAAVFSLPSHLEGFGLPVLEAMLLGCPVVVSDSSSLPEVVGEAGLVARTGDAVSLGEAIARVLTEPGCAEALAEAGRQRAGLFTWEKTADLTLAVYEEAAESRR